jgi:acyl carrier protein
VSLTEAIEGVTVEPGENTMALAHSTLRTPTIDAFPPPGSEPWLRALVADRLGVAEADLAFHVSLTDDLAADSLDLADLAAAIEMDLGIPVPAAFLRRVHTYGDLADLAGALVRERVRRARDGRALLHTRLSSPVAGAATERVFWLDPYAIEILLDDAEHALAGTRLDVLVDPATPPAVLARLRERLSSLERRGIAVRVHRDPRAA